MSTQPAPVVTAFDWVPDFAKGLVRDLRVRWAFEEIGAPYAIEKFGAGQPRPEGYVDWQPFEQVPALRDGELELFETGAILLYLAEKHGALLPKDEQARWQAIAWVFAGLNSVEPSFQRYFAYHVFNAGKDWTEGAKEAVVPLVRQKLKRVSDALGNKDWLAGEFSIADIMMVTVLNGLRDTDFLGEFPSLKAYHARGTARPAYQRALKAQLDDFTGAPPAAAA
ncbi:glutathione S-transferase family protein [Altererythrobacter salegens]|uniref:Glutathione S-transferase family protein n=1 Tax=Croceibacterium salegens TaxID=1737568 RepID=A0A6I4SXT0_9SPHN|nr:glutathione S-transferase family protein [Croceibacterium salegens]MXO60238.1 glutathione S-transferase family protein [Croceibacterium salegens]